MEARLVWDTWRRILASDRLVDMITRDRGDAAVAAGFGPVETAVFAEYARTPAQTETNIRMFRSGLIRNALGSLNRAPLSQRLLYLSGLDPDQVAGAFVRDRGYVDDGPSFWRLAGALIDHLAVLPEFAAPSHQDGLALERALVALARRLGETAVEVWPDEAAAVAGTRSPGTTTRFVATRAAAVVTSHHDLTSWIENPRGFDPREALPAARLHWLIYFPSPDGAPEYAEISERAARVFGLLATAMTADELAAAAGAMPDLDVRKVLASLAQLGVVLTGTPAAPPALDVRPGSPAVPLSDADFVMLDPAVEVLDVAVAGHRLLRHAGLDVGMVVPPGDGLLDFVTAVMGAPVRVGALRQRYDDRRLIDTMLGTLRQHGLLHVTRSAPPSADELAGLRRAVVERRGRTLCRAVTIDLEDATATQVCAGLAEAGLAPELRLRCARLVDHADTLATLAALRRAGQLRLHEVTIASRALDGVAAVVPALRGLGAAVILAGAAWPAPEAAIPGVDDLTRAGVPVLAAMRPGRAFLDPAARARAVAWASSSFLTGLCLELDPDALWPEVAPTADELVAVLEAAQAIEDAVGDLRLIGLPSDEVLLGNAVGDPPATASDTAGRFRAAYVRWRLPWLKAAEGDNTFSQTPEAEDKLVRRSEDLLPNHPELLGVTAGSLIVDVCGGNGRVARRLSPLVGPDGLVVSIELLRCVTDRARRFAGDLGFANVQFRTGLAQRLPLPDAVADAAVNEWTGAIWQLGLGEAMVAEMARVVRPGGRVAVTHRLVRLALDRLAEPWVQFDDIYALMRAAFARRELTIVAERIWGQTVSTLVGERAVAWRKHYLPRVVNPFEVTYSHDDQPGPRADVCLTLIAERR